MKIAKHDKVQQFQISQLFIIIKVYYLKIYMFMCVYIQQATGTKSFIIINIFFMFFESLYCSSSLHLFEQKYRKTTSAITPVFNVT